MSCSAGSWPVSLRRILLLKSKSIARQHSIHWFQIVPAHSSLPIIILPKVCSYASLDEWALIAQWMVKMAYCWNRQTCYCNYCNTKTSILAFLEVDSLDLYRTPNTIRQWFKTIFSRLAAVLRWFSPWFTSNTFFMHASLPFHRQSHTTFYILRHLTYSILHTTY